MADLDFELLPVLRKELADTDEIKTEEKNARQRQEMDAGIEAQKKVVELGSVFWIELLSWGSVRSLLTPDEKGFVSVGGRIPRKYLRKRRASECCRFWKECRKRGSRLLLESQEHLDGFYGNRIGSTTGKRNRARAAAAGWQSAASRASAWRVRAHPRCRFESRADGLNAV